jgi:hypothetical protein
MIAPEPYVTLLGLIETVRVPHGNLDISQYLILTLKLPLLSL